MVDSIPEVIKNNLLEYCRKQGGVRVDIIGKDKPTKSGLSFDLNGKAKVLTADISIITYIENMMKYCRHDISIMVNNIGLKDLPIIPLALEVDKNDPQ